MRLWRTILAVVVTLTVAGPVKADGDAHHHVLDTSEEGMKRIAGALGVKCFHCHTEKKADGKPDFDAPSPLKATAIHMKTHFVDSLRTAEGKALECQTCHQGVAKFVPRAIDPDLAALSANMERREVMKLMRGFTKSLGVKCLHCHEKAKDGRMDPKIPTENRRIARYMYDHFGSLTLLDGQPATCMTCHQGKVTFLPRSEG